MPRLDHMGRDDGRPHLHTCLYMIEGSQYLVYMVNNVEYVTYLIDLKKLGP